MAKISLSGAMRRILISFVCLLACTGARAAQERLSIASSYGEQTFQVEIANTPEARATGLMHRRELSADAGMLFDFLNSTSVSMWMKDTLIPLDMLFIRADGHIANIAERTVPGSLIPIESRGPVRGVLELNGGTSARLGIKPGDRVIHPIFENAP